MYKLYKVGPPPTSRASTSPRTKRGGSLAQSRAAAAVWNDAWPQLPNFQPLTRQGYSSPPADHGSMSYVIRVEEEGSNGLVATTQVINHIVHFLCCVLCFDPHDLETAAPARRCGIDSLFFVAFLVLGVDL